MPKMTSGKVAKWQNGKADQTPVAVFLRKLIFCPYSFKVKLKKGRVFKYQLQEVNSIHAKTFLK